MYVWFSGLCGFLDEVRAFSGWPHDHREKIFQSNDHVKESTDFDIGGFSVVKIIRDPYSRAVSIFRQAIRTGIVDRDISFYEFLAMLARLDMEAANVHYRPQWHPFEIERKPDTIINVSKGDLFAELNALEKRMKWPVTDFAGMTWLHNMEKSRRPATLPPRKRPWFREPIVRSPNPMDTPFPDDAALLTPFAKRMIEEVYDIDFEVYRDYL